METPYRMESPLGATVVINGRPTDYFMGTSYYTLHGNDDVIAASRRAGDQFGLGPATGISIDIYDDVEKASCDFFGTESATYMASGYLSVSILLDALRDDFDLIFVDTKSHYCIFDALRSHKKPIFEFEHLNSVDLARLLDKHVGKGHRPLILTDGVFPSTGALAPLDEYAKVMQSYDTAILCIDDAHGVGVLGPNGRGSFDHFGLQGAQYCLAGTLSKAFGGYGGLIPGSSEIAEKIARNANLMVGASRPPIPAAAAACAGLKLLSNPKIREKLQGNVAHLQKGLLKIGLEIKSSPVPILNISGPSDLAEVSRQLASRGILVRHVPAGGYSDAPGCETLRIAVFSTHSREQLENLINTLGELL